MCIVIRDKYFGKFAYLSARWFHCSDDSHQLLQYVLLVEIFACVLDVGVNCSDFRRHSLSGRNDVKFLS